MEISRRAILSSALIGGIGLSTGNLSINDEAHAGSGYRFNNVFVFPPSTASQAQSLVSTIGGNPITFGHRLKPISTSSLPSSVASAVSGKAYTVEGVGYIHRNALEGRDKIISANGVKWTVVPRGNGTVIVSSQNPDKLEELIKASRNVGRKAFIGLPIPVMSTSQPWFPDLSYQNVFEDFSYTAVKDLSAKGARVFYLSTEMPLRANSYWGSVRKVYNIQSQAISSVVSGSEVLVSPYFQKGDSPSNAAQGALSIVNSMRSVHTIVSPQDGLGTGTASLSKKSGLRTVDEYFRAISGSVPNLHATIECMTPGGGSSSTRGTTSSSSIKRQIGTVRPYVSHISAFMWKDSASLKQVSGNEQFRTGAFFTGGAPVRKPNQPALTTKKPASQKPAQKPTAKKSDKTPQSSAAPASKTRAPSPTAESKKNDANPSQNGAASTPPSSPSAKPSPVSTPSATTAPSTVPSASPSVKPTGNPYGEIKGYSLPSDGGGEVGPGPSDGGSSEISRNSSHDIFPEGQKGNSRLTPTSIALGVLGTGASVIAGASLLKRPKKSIASQLISTDSPQDISENSSNFKKD